jgi:2-iminobutanoate/2-iminopropanoate deaminase
MAKARSSFRPWRDLELIPHNPDDGVYSTGGDWIHALEVRGAGRLLFVSGTMGLRPDFTAPVTLEEQLEWVWSNLRAILANAGMTVDNVVRLTSYLRDPSFAEANAQARIRTLGDRRVPTTAIVVQTLDENWLVELEIIAAG